MIEEREALRIIQNSKLRFAANGREEIRSHHQGCDRYKCVHRRAAEFYGCLTCFVTVGLPAETGTIAFGTPPSIPEIITMSTLTIHLPNSIRSHVERLAAVDGITVDQFIATSTAEKLAVLEAGNYIRSRADKADDGEFERLLEKIPAVQPTEEWDRL